MNGHPKKESKPKIFGRKISGEAPGKLRAHIIKCIRLAEGVGFEPTLGLLLSLISSQVPSTTQPPFPPGRTGLNHRAGAGNSNRVQT